MILYNKNKMMKIIRNKKIACAIKEVFSINNTLKKGKTINNETTDKIKIKIMMVFNNNIS